MKRKLKRIAPVKFGLVAGLVYALLSLVIVPFVLIFVGISAFAETMAHSDEAGPSWAGGCLGAVIAMVLAPIIYGVLGCLMGMLVAWLYNVVAGWIGGIEFDVE